MALKIGLNRALHFIDFLAVIIFGLFIILGVYYYWQFSQILHKEQILREYHLTSSASLYSAYAQWSLINQHLNSPGQSPGGQHRHTEHDTGTEGIMILRDHLYLIGRDLQIISDLQREYQHASFIDITKRLSLAYAEFNNIIQEINKNSAHDAGLKVHHAAARLGQVIDQAKRLHARESGMLSGEMRAVYNKNYLIVFVISLILITLAVIIYMHIRKLIRQNIATQKQTNQLLLQKTSEFEAIFHAIPDVVIYADTDRRIRMTNPALQSIFGYSIDELNGMKTKMLYADPEDYNKQGKIRYKEGVTEQNPLYEMRYRRKSGDTFIGETLASMINGPDGRILGYIALIRDISERIETEEELQQYQHHLGELVDERTRELQTYMDELESFSYSITHDLRTPLRAIDGYSHLVSDEYRDKLDDNAKNYLMRIRLAAQRMGKLIDDVLQLTRVTRSELTYTRVNLNNIAQEIVKDLQITDPDRNVTWKIASDMHTQGDESLLRLLLENLLGNAWKYTGKCTNAKIEFGCNEQNNETVYYIKDNGAGFDMQYSNKLFKAFHRLHDVDEYPGAGIGLATVQRIIHRHGGRVWVQAQEGKGATFYFTLQRAKS